MAVLDDLSGFEFEDVIEDVFRNLGYENVRQADRTADEGRDVLMEEVVDGTRRAIIVECKHTGTVGRPVVQKLHSAIATFDFDGPKRGMVVTTGRFTNPAQEYANRLQQNDDPHAIELLDGEDLREIADEIGLDLYNGRIEILCDETLRPYDPAADVDAAVEVAFATSRTSRRRPPGTTFGGDVPPSGRGHRGHERRLRDVGGCHPPDQRPDAVRRPRRTRAAAGRRRRRRDAGHREPPCDGRSRRRAVRSSVRRRRGEPVRPDADRVQRSGPSSGSSSTTRRR